MTRRRSRRSRSSSSWMAWTGVAVLTLVVVAGLTWAVNAQRTATRLDPDTLCDVNGPSGVTVVLIDATDQLSDIQRAAVTGRLNRVIQRDLRRNERLEIFEITDSNDLLSPEFSMCRPASPDEIDELTENRRVAQQRFDEAFRPAIDTVMRGLLNRPPSEQSPIMEAVQAASVAAFQASDVSDTTPKRLIIVSDMLQNGPAGRHYGGVPEFSTYRSEPQFRRYLSDLTGVEVRVLYLHRESGDAVQGEAHGSFWLRWFEAQGVTTASVDPIEG